MERRARYEAGLEFESVYPYRNDGKCRCGCGGEVAAPRRVWCSPECTTRAVRTFRILKGDSREIRHALYGRDRGRCAACQRRCGRRAWEADHIVPVAHGGAGCDLENFQTLCRDCHRAKTTDQLRRRAAARKETESAGEVREDGTVSA